MSSAKQTVSRRDVVLGGLALTALPTSVGASAAEPDPDFGPNVMIIDPDTPRAVVQRALDDVFHKMERAQFSHDRFAFLLKPGRYAVDANIGFYTQIAGLGVLPDDVTIAGHVHSEADWAQGMALVNFWRGAENLSVGPPDGADRWAVSQAAPYRRMHLQGDLRLDDGGWSSGGFIGDCRIDGTIRSGTQQQWFTRNSAIGGWQGSNWNMMFAGTVGAPADQFPKPPFTTKDRVPVVRDKPFLCLDAAGRWQVFAPAVREDARGPSWSSQRGPGAGRSIPLSHFFIARPHMSATRINAALARGLHLLLTPGVYELDTPLAVRNEGTIVLGLGFATLRPMTGSAAMTVADVSGVTIAGLLIDAGPTLSPILVQIGPRGSRRDHRSDPTLLCDLFFRVGGAASGRAGTCLEINSHWVLGDHLWVWRADHGDRAAGNVHVGWDDNIGDQGLVVNGDDVSMYALFVEHFRRYNTLWNGERGRTWFYQNELPYDPPSQAAYMAGRHNGWAAYKVADAVNHHHAVALGIYVNFTADPTIVLDSAIEAPRKPDIRFDHVTTVSLGGGKGTIAHAVNGAGISATSGAVHQTLVHYP